MKPLTLPSLCLLLSTLHAQTFQVVNQVLAVPVTMGRVAIGDVDGDGHPDLVHAGMSTSVLLTGGPGGVFAAPLPLPATLFSSWVQLVDSNRDGRLDLWRCDNALGCVRFEATATGLVVTANLGQARSMACADFDSDGHVDVVVGADTGLALARGDGQGGFVPPVTFSPPPGFLTFVQCLCGDLNGDGHADLVVTEFSAPKAFLGNGAGGFRVRALPLPIGTRMCLADVDNDGDLDLVAGVASTIPNALVVRNNGFGQFSAPQAIPGMNTQENVAADFDGDGMLDLVGISQTAMLLARGVGGGQFATPISFPMVSPFGLVAGDIDGDGRVEALVLSNLTNLMVLRLVDAPPPGLAAFGSVTPACAGTIGIRGTVEPTLGAPGFRVQCTNVPEVSTGLLAIGTAVPGGWQPLGLGLQFHLGTGSPLATMRSDVGGTASVGLSLPANPIFSGLTAHLQSFWLADARRGNTCSTAAFELASSRGLSVTLH